MSVAEPVKQDNAEPRRPRLPNFAAFILTIAVVWLGGQFVTQGVSDYLLDSNPGDAVLWRGDSSDALTRFASSLLPLKRYQLAQRIAGKALQLAPLNATAISAFGLALDGQGYADRADRVMTIAGQRSWRDIPTQVWLLRKRLLQGNYVDGFQHVDALLRQEDKYPPLPLAIMAAAAIDPKAVQPLVDRLAYSPPWRGPFFIFLAAAPRPELDTVDDALMTGLQATRAPPTDQELGYYLTRLLNEQKYQQAEQDWRRLSPPGVVTSAILSNGDFEKPARATPFDWIVVSGIGWTAQLADAPGEGHGKALNVDYDGVSPAQPLRQYLVLAPGAYRLSGMLYDQSGQGGDPLSWKIICAGATDTVASAPFVPGNQGEWRPFSVDLTVPPTGCPAQMLSLSADPGDVHKDIEVWYDNLAITQIAPPSGAPAQFGGAPASGR
ncbi:MAG TPA: hypothetical protein VHW60_22415 [Caulobacteraceae bacterium]|jgi:hypothetical protein|nr:hypothetical protein [Caulobacteraceae bacterium]